jgi:hypothetical protein
LALLENVAIATLYLITWRVPLGNRFWSNRVFSLSKRGAKLKSDLPKSKSLVFCLLGFAFLSSTLPFVPLTHLPEENRDVDFDTFSPDNSSLPVLHTPPASHDERKAEQNVPENGRFRDDIFSRDLSHLSHPDTYPRSYFSLTCGMSI